MATVFINDANLTTIADAIRNINESTNNYLPSEMAAALRAIVIQKYYTGTTEPDATLGNEGDLYLKIS